ncbi:MAG: D-2-hydroxyacid dehydrogenase [Clostridia bacterium]|nr:D-2-hydroxyacid dehydrogenase [Clostridia bacterium]
MKTVVLDGYTTNPGDLTWDSFEKFGELTIYDRTPPHLVAERINDAQIVVTNKALITKEVINKCPNIKFITTLATGYNAVDVSYAKKLGIPVSNVPEYSTKSVAQLVFSYILHHFNKVAELNNSVKNGDWCNSEDFCYWVTQLTALKGLTIGIVGYGAIGREVAKIAEAFSMNVIYCNHRNKPYPNSKHTFVSFEQLLEESDIISLHCPLADDTKNLINNDTISKMKKGCLLINTSRGPVINEHDLASALNNDKIYAAVDVVSVEPMQPDNPLLAARNIIITPHIGWAPKTVRENLLEIVQKNIEMFLKGTPQNVVNK